MKLYAFFKRPKKPERQKFYGLMHDAVFKAVFGNPRNLQTVTRRFLQDILPLPHAQYDTLTVENPFLHPRFWRDKMGIVDLKLLTKDKSVIHVEIQEAKDSAMAERILFYWSRLYADQLSMGHKYNKLKPVICVLICNFIREREESEEEEDGGEPQAIERYSIYNERLKKRWTNKLQIVTIELPLMPEQDDGQPEWAWLQAFKCKTKEELVTLAMKHKKIDPMAHLVIKYNLPERIRLYLRAREDWKRDQAFLVDMARERGLKQGLEKGRAEGLDEGMVKGRAESAEIIAEQAAEIAELKRQLAQK
jgi:predicted transposase/invertase (TIGR01784 family)